MFVVLLKFSANQSHAGDWMAGHNEWLQQGFDDGVFVAAGSLSGRQGGCILAHRTDSESLNRRLEQDPFVVHDVVRVEVIEFALAKTHPELAFLMGAPA